MWSFGQQNRSMSGADKHLQPVQAEHIRKFVRKNPNHGIDSRVSGSRVVMNMNSVTYFVHIAKQNCRRQGRIGLVT